MSEINPVGLNDWIYIYRIPGEDSTVRPPEFKKNIISYDRSMPRNCLRQVKERVKELESRGDEAFYTIGRIMQGAFS